MLDTQYTSAKCECLCCIHRCTTSQRAFPLSLPIMEQRQIPMSLSCHRITTKQTKLSSFLISHLSFANIYLSQSLIIQQPNHRPNPQTHQIMPCIPYVHGGISPPPSTPPSKKSPSNPTDSPPKTLETTHDAKGTSAGYVKDRSRHTASGPFNANLTTPTSNTAGTTPNTPLPTRPHSQRGHTPPFRSRRLGTRLRNIWGTVVKAKMEGS